MGAIEVLPFDEVGFFAPVSSDLVDSLVGQYKSLRSGIESLCSAVTSEFSGAMQHVLEGNRSDGRHHPSVESLFNESGKAGAIAHLNASYWSKAMQMTDVFDYMPQKRRDEWSKQIQNPRGVKNGGYSNEWESEPLPDFEETTVRSTLQSLMAMRSQFLAERVDGIFRSLSGEHVTNSPMGFGKRMIISGVTDSFSYTNTSRCGTINDLRAVIAKFMGRDEPKHYHTGPVVSAARRNSGQWMSLDGGSIRIRVYLKGTAHLEVHPDMAWRLNCILAQLHPLAIPSEFRQKPKKQPKDFVMMGRPLPFAVLDVISNLRRDRNTNCFSFGYGVGNDKLANKEANRVLESIGGIVSGNRVEFDYDARAALDEIICSGCIPDDKSHQFYPTPTVLAERVIELAEIKDGNQCLEPSAGTGALADLMPKGAICCEVSALRCAILKAKGYEVIHDDFMRISAPSVDRICMNPPFDQGRWKAHLEHASTLLRDGGRLVAILPSGAKNSAALPGFDMTWHGPFDNQFPGASVSVVILVAERTK